MKILSVFNQYLEPGGEANAVDAIDEALRYVADVRRCEFSSAEWTGRNAPNPVQQAAWMIRNPSSVARLRRAQVEFGADVWLLHNVFPVGSAAVYAVARQLGIPIIQYIHNYRPFSVNGYLWARDHLATGGLSLNYLAEIRSGAWQDSVLKSAWFATVLWFTHLRGDWRSPRAWIAISEFVRQKFIAAGVPQDAVFTLPHYWRPGPRLEPRDSEHYLFLGRLVDIKGVNVLLDAWEIMEHEFGAATPRLIIGGDGPLRDTVAARAERSTSIVYGGHLSAIAKADALRAARAVIVPSIWWEAAGLVVYEAYDVSRPVLASRSGALPEAVHDGETGLLHAPGDARDLAEQVMRLEHDRTLAREMGRNGRRWLEANRGETEWQRRFGEIAERAVGVVR